MSKHFKLEREDDGLAVLTFDTPGYKVNKYDEGVFDELDALLVELKGASNVKALLLLSGKPATFIAGADVKQIAVADASSIEPAIRRGQDVFGRLAALPFPTVAAIAGACVGGGLETVLACDWRIASDAKRVQIGLPEVRLGILPAWGGTTRLPRLIGLAGALDLILSGRMLDGARARRAGVVDEVVTDALLVGRGRALARECFGSPKRANAAPDGGPARARPRTFMDTVLETIGKSIVFGKAKKNVLDQTGGHYPAPLEALEVVRQGWGGTLKDGLALELKHAQRLVGTPVMRNLVTLFLRTEAVKKETGLEGVVSHVPAPRTITHIGVLGAGVMGGGIAQLAAAKGYPARMKDISLDALASGYGAAAKVLEDGVKRRRMSKLEMVHKMDLLSGTLDYSGFARCEVTIEAVVEKLAVKQAVLAEWEAVVSDSTIFASNTSTLPITDIQSVAKHPERVGGMHFFNPVNRMPLVEVIYGAQTAPEVTATIFDLARRLGKTPVAVKDAPGFLVNRILAPYLGEAARLLNQGYRIESIDNAMKRFGMPVGPIELLDDVGLDVAAKAADILTAAWPDRLPADPALHKLVGLGRLGRKAARGFYRYEGSKRLAVDESVYADLGLGVPGKDLAAEAAETQLVLPLINEAAYCLADGIVPTPDKLDLAMVFGTGFPPFRGGPLKCADAIGLSDVVERLRRLEQEHGARFAPSEELASRAQANRLFFP
jgi:3-hydroxyacyl-CoA dehydrogenase/enoyl-CoA hydratase/3-hydroxybutyryl-CoA epimerase